MKRIFFVVLSLFVAISFSVKAQIHFEIGAGYLNTLNNNDIFLHTDGGWQIGGAVFYEISEALELKTSLLYQSRFFDSNSFSFVVPAVVGVSIPTVTGGDNLNSLGIAIGGRLKTKSDKIVKPVLGVDVGINYYQDSYYDLKYVNGGIVTSVQRKKYFDSRVLFETSLGFGFEVTPLENFSIILEGRANYIPVERNVYFPIIINLRVGI